MNTLLIPGVDISIRQLGVSDPLDIGPAGLIGWLAPTGYTIQARVNLLHPGQRIHGFCVSGRQHKHITLAKAHATKEGNGSCRFIQRVATWDTGKIVVPDDDCNRLRLLQLTSEGDLTIWEIALSVQDGPAYVTIQDTHHFRCYRNGYRVVCPALHRIQPELVDFLEELWSINHWPLEDISTYTPEPIIDTSKWNDHQGTVVFWSDAGNFGCLATNKGLAYVRWSFLKQSSSQRRYLLAEDVVCFETLTTSIIPGSHFAWEAKGVTVLTRP